MDPSDRDEPTTESAGVPDAPPADWLAEVGGRAGLGVEAIDALAGWLAAQAEVERFAQLERAGHSVEERIPLARVFVDLQVGRAPVGEVGRREQETQPFLAFLNAPEEQRREPRDANRVEGYALLGGPGQGKSTLGQLLCQLHRAWLLRPRLDRLATQPERDAVEAFTDERAVASLGRPAELGFPIRIALADAASWLSRRGDRVEAADAPTLLSYVKEHLGCPVGPADLLRLLSAGDWLLVLDGLDEVPPSADRSRLIAAWKELIRRLIAGGQHGVLLATTRPQGYSGEFEDLGVDLRSRYLAPFTNEEALTYARRLVEARFTSDRRDKVLHRLEQAAEGETTARLMRTPLQVTILATLVDRIGRAPSEQWTLFREYYRVIYEREMERPFDAAQILREYRRYVDKIHMHVGLVLQVESEQAGGTESAFSRERFKHLVDAVLAQDEIDGARRQDLVRRIDDALRDRLVLLVDRGQDQLGFEIRSIQELMAAWALSQKGEAIVEQRIQQIVKAGAFRNVVLFLASKAFTDSDVVELRDAFTDRICPWLNEDPEDPLSRAAMAGSVLALEMLEEGSLLKRDKYVRKLVTLAVRLLDLPPSRIHGRLAEVCLMVQDIRQLAMPILRDAVARRFGDAEPTEWIAAWESAYRLGGTDGAATWLTSQGAQAGVRFDDAATQGAADVLAATPSNLADPATWDRLHLPLPRPERRLPSDRPPPSEQPRLQIGPLSLQNLRAFEDFTLAPADPPADAGQWIVLLGENGMGKTTILRSLVFALVDVTSQPNRLPRSAFETPWRRRGTDKDMPSAVQVTIHGTSYRATITVDPARANKEALVQGTSFPSSPIFAYGCRRGSALGGGTRRVDVDPGAEIPTLFDEGADLIHAETWLLLREGAGMRDKADNGPAWRLYQSILRALVSILPGLDAIEGRGDKVWVRGPEVGEIPLEALSDGYLTTMGWAIDLMARWIKRAEIRKDPIADDFTKTMTGLVLIDEIDLHLHPEWQRRVIADVRAIFPRMSFLVTTHNPLTLIGARAEEIWKLTRNGGGRIAAVQGRERPALMTSSEILESYFDIRTLFPDELGAMLNRYGFLARDSTRTDEEDEEMRRILATLQERGVEPGYEPTEREEIPPYPGDPEA